MSSSSTTRAEWHACIFPRGIPSLWCPLLTHYRDDGSLDHARISAHLHHLAPHVKGFLIPGSTGDGWEMSDTEIRELIRLAQVLTAELDLHLLVGVLKTEARDACTMLREFSRAHPTEIAQPKIRSSPAFTVCPPKGKDLPQDLIRKALAEILGLGLPTALYQLPQVTMNEMSPETVAELAERFPNFILFKDTSGADRVAGSGRDLSGVFLVRGAEGDYANWLRSGGGAYNGFLLSTANCFGRDLHQLIELLETGQREAAQHLSGRLSAVVKEVFTLVTGLADGNAFANANKAMDHFFAHGPNAACVTPPRLHAGSRLPVEVIRRAGEALGRHGFLPTRGYLE